MGRVALTFVVGLGFAIAPACGGASSTDLNGGTGSSSGAGSSSGNGSGSSSGGTSASSSGGVAPPVDAGVDTGNPKPHPDGGATDSSVPEDAGLVDTTPVDDVVVDSGPPPGPSVLCPMQGQPATCNPGDYCCVTGANSNQKDQCEQPNQSCSGTTVQCASRADCPSGEVCCGQKDVTMLRFVQVSCRASCVGLDLVTFCDPAAMDCPNGMPTCAQSPILIGYGVCQ